MLGVGWVGAIADAAPAAMGIYLPTIDQAKAYNKLKLQPIIDATPAMRRKIYTQRSRDEMGSSTLFKRFAGGSCKITGTNASAGLQMASEKYQIKEEISEWLLDVEGRGDPDTQVDARRLAYLEEGAKVFTISTPGTKGTCRVTAKFEASDQRRNYVPCPECGERQVLKWQQFKFERTAPHNTHYACEHCGALIAHHFKRWMVQSGEWRAEAPGQGRPPGFHIWQAYSLMNSWDDIVAAFVAADGKPDKVKTFTQQGLGEAYEEKGDAPPVDLLIGRRESFKLGQIPKGALFLTGAADVQANRIEWDVYAWGRDLESWLIDFGVVEGNPADRETWRRFDPVVTRKYEDFAGISQQIDAFGIDSGFLSQKVYDYVRSRGYTSRLFALDGRSGWKLPAIGTPVKRDVDYDGVKVGEVMLWPVGTWDMKSELYAALAKTISGPDPQTGLLGQGVAHYNEHCDKDYFEQLTAEHLREPKGNAMKGKSWEKLRPRNERHDNAVYARALAHHLSDRLTPKDWDALEVKRATPPAPAQADMAAIWAGQPEAVAAEQQRAAEGAKPEPEQPAPKVNKFTGRSGWL